MIFLDSIKIALRALGAHKARSGLAVLGVTIGITSVIVVFAAGEGINSLVLGQIEVFGSKMIETELKVPSSKTGYASEQQSATNLIQGVQITTLTLDDMEDLLKLPNIDGAYAGIMAQEPITYGEEMRRTVVLATTASYIDLDRSEIATGRFYTETEDKSLAKVVVLGSKMKEKLFGDSDPLGKSIKIRKVRFRVIGVLKELGAMMGMDFDDFIYVPVRTMQKSIMGIDYVHYMMHRTVDASLVNDTAEEMRMILRNNHNIAQPAEDRGGWEDTGKDDFRVVSMAEIIEVWGRMSWALTALLLAIVAVSLVVGGVGVMNVMYVIVNERTSEIGLRKAVGAKYSDIMWQFIMESIIITLAGGVMGVIIGVILSYLISVGAEFVGLDWRFGVPLKAFVTATGFSIIFGIIFGAYPARRAASLDPVQALRAE